MIGKYFTNWVHFTLLIWYVMYIFKIRGYNYINLYYPCILILLGYIILYLYYYLILQYKFQISLILFQLFTHSFPLMLLIYLNQTHSNYSLLTLFILIIIYIIYLRTINKTIYQVYFVDRYPKTWKDIKEICQTDEKNYFPITVIYLCNYLNK